ncbi:probable inactive receptor kinase At2g26730 [Mangifera indica]|uniref:probable inactive receptor kinase At2g26730 n=1 Tax=Mangifera indica TaxID=29780 RepID=UPI001CFA13E0|nr:probable inactive receptor kinase At2g26730 [Mangifera indica]
MNQTPLWVTFLSFFIILHTTHSLDAVVKSSLINFLSELSNNNALLNSVWNTSTDPCTDRWTGVTCNSRKNSVSRLNLTRLNLSGSFDASHLCNDQSLAASLSVIILDGNNIQGEISADISNCTQLSRLRLSQNRISGNLTGSLSLLSNLKRLDVSYNNFTGALPDLSRISGLTMFLAQYNQFTDKIPQFDFSNLRQFNVSYNDLSGPIPDTRGKFDLSSFFHNPKLCGDPLPNKCPPTPPSNLEGKKSKHVSKTRILIFSGYAVLGLLAIVFITWRICKRRKSEQKVEAVNNVESADDSNINKSKSFESRDYITGESKSELSMNSAESSLPSSSLVVLTSPVVNGLKFGELLRAPAELLGRRKNGTLYKIVLENGMNLVVKRIKDWAISSNDFKLRMQRLDQAKHPNILPALAFYCSKQEKLLVYEFQENGSLFRLLHGAQMGQAFDWARRLDIAAKISEALSFMHQELGEAGIAHGNLKSSNILFNKSMEPCISEYGLMAFDIQDSSTFANGFKCPAGAIAASSFAYKADIYGLGVILLELLTGRPMQKDGVDLTTWVHSVVREEWTVEVFDKGLISEGASEERMVHLLQVAIKCVNRSPATRPTISQVAAMINAIKEEEERSIVSEA